MSASTHHPLPQPGDVVIYQRPGPADGYLLSSFQRASPLTFHERGDAVHDAVQIATHDHVDAWSTDDGQTYRRLAAHRGQGTDYPAAA